MRNKIIIGAIVLVAAFLLGFIPQFARARRLEGELRAARQASAGAELRDLAGLAYVQASQKNYGLAAGTSGRFFNRAREAAGQSANASGRKALEEILSSRDRITAELAKGDASVLTDLQDLFLKTRQATGAGGGM